MFFFFVTLFVVHGGALYSHAAGIAKKGSKLPLTSRRNVEAPGAGMIESRGSGNGPARGYEAIVFAAGVVLGLVTPSFLGSPAFFASESAWEGQRKTEGVFVSHSRS